MLRTTSININDIRQGDKFEPELWIFQEFMGKIISSYKRDKINKYASYITNLSQRRIVPDFEHSPERRVGRERRIGIDRRR